MAGGDVLAVDPGRDKCGLALVAGDGRLLWRGIVPTAELPARVGEIVAAHGPGKILLGNGTWSKRLRPLIEETLGSPGGPTLLMVDEKHSTERARGLYWAHNAPRGLWRLVPQGLRVPREAYDDFAALVLALDFLGLGESVGLPPGRSR